MKTRLFLTLIIVVIVGISVIQYAYSLDYTSIAAILNHYEKEIVTIKDLDADVKEYFLTVEQQKNPGVINADFDGDGKEDVALLTKEAKSNALTLRFFLCKKRCKEISTIGLGAFYGIQYLTPVNKGEVVQTTASLPSPPDITSVRLANTAVRLVVYGKGHIVYFWDKKNQAFVSITTGD